MCVDEKNIKAADDAHVIVIKCLGVVTIFDDELAEYLTYEFVSSTLAPPLIAFVPSNGRHILILHSSHRYRHATIAIQRDNIIKLLEQPARINIIRR